MAKKKNKKKNNNVKPVVVNEDLQTEETSVPEEVETSKVETEETKKQQIKDNEKKKNKKKKEKKPSKIVKGTKETISELKKVSWPKFSTVVKQTGVVIAVIIFFTLVIFGIDQLLSLLTGLIYK